MSVSSASRIRKKKKKGKKGKRTASKAGSEFDMSEKGENDKSLRESLSP